MVDFDFLDKPEKFAVEDALKQLYLLGAIDSDGRVQNMGRELVKLPLEPTFGKCLLAARYLSKDCEQDMAKLVSLLSTENIWQGVSRFDEARRKKQDDVKYSFRNSQSDHMALVQIFDKYL